MDQVADGVYQVPGFSNAYLIDGDSGIVLIDTGMPKREGAVLNIIRGIGRKPSDVIAIAITHAHADHFGSAAALKRATGAATVASGADTPAIAGRAPIPAPPLLDLVPFLRPLLRLMPEADPVEVDRTVSASDSGGLPEELSVIETPGHTPGHVSYLLDRDGGILFVGDAAVVSRAGGIKRGYMNRRTQTFDASLRHLAEFDFDKAFFAHSRALHTGAAAEFRDFAAGL